MLIKHTKIVCPLRLYIISEGSEKGIIIVPELIGKGLNSEERVSERDRDRYLFCPNTNT